MRSAAVLLAVLVGPACGRIGFAVVGASAVDGTSGGIVAVQSVSGTDGGSTTVAVTFGSASTVGDVIAVAVSWEGVSAITGVRDSNDDVYTLVDLVNGSASQAQTAYATITAGGVITVTAQLAASSTGLEMIAHELHGADPSSPLVSHDAKSQITPGTSTDAVSTGTMTLTGPNDYVFGASFNVSGNDATYTHGTGFTLALMGNKGNSTTFMSEYATQLEPATFTIDQTVGIYMTLGMVFAPRP